MGRGVQYNRTPCPARVFEDLGNGFAMGCFGGSLLYFVKGTVTIYKSAHYILRCMERPQASTNV